MKNLVERKTYIVEVLGFKGKPYAEKKTFKCHYLGKDVGCYVFAIVGTSQLLYADRKTMNFRIKEV